MKRIVLSTLTIIFSLLGSCFAEDLGYNITNYIIDYYIQDDGKISVTEDVTIHYNVVSHGFFREIPFLYERNDNKLLKTPITNISVEGAKFQKSKQGNYLSLKIGSKNETVIGDKNYKIHYQIEGAIRSFSGWQELYWNLIGTERDTPINQAKFEVHLPSKNIVSEGNYYAMIGKFGSKKEIKLSKRGNVIENVDLISLNANEGVTISIKFPANTFITREILVRKTLWRKIVNYFDTEEKKNNLVYCLYGICLAFVIRSLRVMYKYLRKKEDRYFLSKKEWDAVKDVIYYDPPKGYLPWDVAVIKDLKSTTTVFSSMLYYRIGEGLVEIAMKGIKGRKVCFVKKENIDIEKYQFHQYDDMKNNNSPERDYWDFCFKEKDTYYPSDSLLPEKADQLKKIADNIYYIIMKRFCPGVPKFILRKYSLSGKEFLSYRIRYTLGIIVSILLGFRSWDFGAWYRSLLPAGICFIYIFMSIVSRYLIVMIISSHLTEEAKDIMAHVLGFKKYLLEVEDQKLNKLINDDPKYFEKYLPYAIALGIGDDWLKKNIVFSEYNPGTNISEFPIDNSGTINLSNLDILRLSLNKSKLIGTLKREVNRETHYYNTDSGRGKSSSSSRWDSDSSRSSSSSSHSGGSHGGFSGGGGGGGGGHRW